MCYVCMYEIHKLWALQMAETQSYTTILKSVEATVYVLSNLFIYLLLLFLKESPLRVNEWRNLLSLPSEKAQISV